ncbi:MAG: hypothetical protein AUI48_02110 [Chloroflexi bacterium 13_1_40CM_2_68_14]|nr:MAG: hypothetical protein AUI48_02110 [Chloroflexi bacterium 13_1_40CM_2_68_14]
MLELLAKPSVHVGISLVAVPVNDRPAFFATLLPRLQEMRTRTGRPHWIVIDEAQHLFPMVTVHPQHVSAAMLEAVDTALAVGKAPERMLQPFGRVPPVELEDGEVLAWSNGQAEPLRLVQEKAQVRHRRKYAAGDLGGEAFVFRGPQGKLKLRAPNLGIFLLMAEGVDDETWMHHLAQRDYSKWFRMALKDDGLAADAEQIESRGGLESRSRIRDAIEKRYTLPA